MSVYTENQEIIIDNINLTNKTISIAKDNVIKKDGVEIARERDRRAFVPGDIMAVEVYIGLSDAPEIDYLNAVWTQDVISAYNAMIADQQIG